MPKFYGFSGGPEGAVASNAEWYADALASPMSIGSTLLQTGVGTALESFGLGTAIRETFIPKGQTAPDLTERVTDAAAAITPTFAMGTAVREGIQYLINDPDSPTMTEEQVKASRYYRGDPYEPGMTEQRLAALADWKDAKAVRAHFAEKRPITALIGGLAGQAVDPINYIPIAGPLVKGAAIARFGHVAGEALTASIDAAANTAVFGAATAPARARYGDDVSFQAQVSQVATAALIGAAFGSIGGAFGARRARREEAAVAANKAAIADAARAAAADVKVTEDFPAEFAKEPIVAGQQAAFEDRLSSDIGAELNGEQLPLKDVITARVPLNESVGSLVDGQDLALSPNATDPIVAHAEQRMANGEWVPTTGYYEVPGAVGREVMNRMAAAGRPRKEAAAAGQLWDSWYASQAKHLGIPVEQLVERVGLPEVRAGELQAAGGQTLHQSGAPLIDKPLPVEPTGGKKGDQITLKDVGAALDADHQQKFGRKLFPETNEEDAAQVAKMANEDMAAQKNRESSGDGWYGTDTDDAIKLTSRVFPTLATNPTHRNVFLTFAGIFGNGPDPTTAWMAAAKAFRQFLRDGEEIPIKRDDGATGFGGKQAGWTQRNAANEQQLGLFKYLAEREGGLDKAFEWLLAKQSRAEINRLMTESGLYKDGRYKSKKDIAGADDYGTLAFGPKLGNYILGLNGVVGDESNATIDKWFTRTYRRWTGRMADGPIDPKDGLPGQPANDAERNAIRRIVGGLMKRYNLNVGDAQARLWFFEKRLYGAHGIRTEEGANTTGARKLLASVGVDDGEGSAPAGGGDGSPLAAGSGGQEAVTLFQGENRGAIQFGTDGKTVISLFANADASTAIHESGHFFLQAFKQLAEHDNAPSQIAADWQKIKDWWRTNAEAVAADSGKADITAADVHAVLNSGTTGDRIKDLAIDVGFHEQWARGFEAYLREGKAPTEGLRKVFDQFKEWLSRIYRQAIDLNVNLTPEVRAVFDNMLGGEKQRVIDTRTTARPTPEPRGLKEAAAVLTRTDTAKDVAAQYGIDLATGHSPELDDIDMLRKMGRLTAEDEAIMKAAEDEAAKDDAYGTALKAALRCELA